MLHCVKQSKLRIYPSIKKEDSYLPLGPAAHEVQNPISIWHVGCNEVGSTHSVQDGGPTRGQGVSELPYEAQRVSLFSIKVRPGRRNGVRP